LSYGRASPGHPREEVREHTQSVPREQVKKITTLPSLSGCGETRLSALYHLGTLPLRFAGGANI